MKYVSIDMERLKGALSGRQTEVSKQIGLTLNSLSRKINGRIALTLDDLNKICEVIQREPSDFIIFKERQKRDTVT